MHETGHAGGHDYDSGRMPLFSVVIPVFNEVGRINNLVAHIRRLDERGCCEIIVVDGEEEATTIEVIEDEEVVRTRIEAGRAKQMNAGAVIAKGAVLVFLHADTTLPEGAFGYVYEALSDERIVGGAFGLEIDTDNVAMRCLAVMSGIRNRVFRVPFGDQAIFIRKEYFDRIGGYADVSFLEDVELMRRIRRRGDRIRILKQRVCTSARRWEAEGIIYTTVRNFMVLLLFGLGVSADRLARFYRSR